MSNQELKEFSLFESELQAFKEKYDDVVYDFSDEAQEKQARADRLAIGKTISSLDKVHKALKEPLKIQVDLLDGKRKEIKDDLLSVQDKIKNQIKQHEEAIAAKAEELQGWVEDIEAIGVFGAMDRIYLSQTDTPDSGTLKARLEDANKLEIDDRFKHRKADATLALVDVIKKLDAMLEARLAHEAEQAELQRLRDEEEERKRLAREDEIRQEAIIKAEQKAADDKLKADLELQQARAAEQKAKDDAKDAEEKAERDAKEAEEAAKDAETKRLKDIQDAKEKSDRETKAAEERHASELREAEENAVREAKEVRETIKAEEQRVIDEQKRREANTRHKGAINRSILAEFAKLGVDEAAGKKIITAIAQGKIDYIKIMY